MHDGTTACRIVHPQSVVLRVALPRDEADSPASTTLLLRGIREAMRGSTWVDFCDASGFGTLGNPDVTETLVSNEFRGDCRGAREYVAFWFCVEVHRGVQLAVGDLLSNVPQCVLVDFGPYGGEPAVPHVDIHAMLRAEARRLGLLGSCRLARTPATWVTRTPVSWAKTLSTSVGSAEPFSFFQADKTHVRAILTDAFSPTGMRARARPETIASDGRDDCRHAHIVFVWHPAGADSERRALAAARRAHPSSAVVSYPLYLRRILSERRMAMQSVSLPAHITTADVGDATVILCTLSYVMRIPVDALCKMSSPERAASMVNLAFARNGHLPLPYTRQDDPRTRDDSGVGISRGGLITHCDAETTFFCAERDSNFRAVHVDFSSFYPSIMVELAQSEDTRMEATRQFFRTYIAWLIKLKKAAARDALRKAYKLASNSVYGSFGARWSVIFSKHIAERIVEGGRTRMEALRKTVGNAGDGCRVVMGHTDSWIALGRTDIVSAAIDEFNTRSDHVKVDIEDRFTVLLAPNTQYAACTLDDAERVADVLGRVRQTLDDGLQELASCVKRLRRANAESVATGVSRDDLIAIVRRCKRQFIAGGIKVQSIFNESDLPISNVVAMYAWGVVMAAILEHRDGFDETREAGGVAGNLWQSMGAMCEAHMGEKYPPSVNAGLYGTRELGADDWSDLWKSVREGAAHSVMRRVEKTAVPDDVCRRIAGVFLIDNPRKSRSAATPSDRRDDPVARLVALVEGDNPQAIDISEWSVETVQKAMVRLDVERYLDEVAASKEDRLRMAEQETIARRRVAFKRTRDIMARLLTSNTM